MIFGYHLNIALIYLILLHSKMKGKLANGFVLILDCGRKDNFFPASKVIVYFAGDLELKSFFLFSQNSLFGNVMRENIFRRVGKANENIVIVLGMLMGFIAQ